MVATANGMSKKESVANAVKQGGFVCPNCGGGISYPNRLMSAILNEYFADGEYETETIFEWSKKVPVSWNPSGKMMRYDFYFPNQKIIIEMNGAQHYVENSFFNTSHLLCVKTYIL